MLENTSSMFMLTKVDSNRRWIPLGLPGEVYVTLGYQELPTCLLSIIVLRGVQGLTSVGNVVTRKGKSSDCKRLNTKLLTVKRNTLSSVSTLKFGVGVEVKTLRSSMARVRLTVALCTAQLLTWNLVEQISCTLLLLVDNPTNKQKR